MFGEQRVGKRAGFLEDPGIFYYARYRGATASILQLDPVGRVIKSSESGSDPACGTDPRSWTLEIRGIPPKNRESARRLLFWGEGIAERVTNWPSIKGGKRQGPWPGKGPDTVAFNKLLGKRTVHF